MTKLVGEIEIAYVIKHRKSKKSRGFGFVVFKNQNDREKLLNDGSFFINDREVKCSAYESKGDKQKNEKDEIRNYEKSEKKNNLFRQLEQKKIE